MKLQICDGRKAFIDKQVLKGTNFTFEQGKIYGLLGRNGAGKTTLFGCISEESPFDSGTKQLVDEYGAPAEWQEAGFVYANPVLPEFLTGYEFIKFFIDVNYERISNPRSVEEYLRLVSLEEDDWYWLIKNYSHGMKNKIQMLCIFIIKPLVLLLDEPLTSFDVIVAHEMKELLKSMKEDHIIIFSTHILQLATDICDEIVVLSDGLLTGMTKEQLHSDGFESQVIQLLEGMELKEEKADA